MFFGWIGFIKPMGIVTLSLLVSTACAGFFMRRKRELLFRWHKRLAVATLIAGGIHATLVFLFL